MPLKIFFLKNLMPLKIYVHDTLYPLFPYSVAISFPCRNNFDKNQANFLESAQNPRTFAASSYI